MSGFSAVQVLYRQNGISTMRKLIFILLAATTHHLIHGQDQLTNTLSCDIVIGSPEVKLPDIAWLQGHWLGEAFGGIIEEIWSPPRGNSMMGIFRLLVSDTVKFYETMTLAEENGSLILRLRHFHRDLKGWEEKNETVNFKLVKVTANRFYFNGLTFERAGKNEINAYVVVVFPDGRKGEVKFNFKRLNPPNH